MRGTWRKRRAEERVLEADRRGAERRDNLTKVLGAGNLRKGLFEGCRYVKGRNCSETAKERDTKGRISREGERRKGKRSRKREVRKGVTGDGWLMKGCYEKVC